MNYRKYLIILLAVLALARVLHILLVPFDLSPDEAHYWEWSRRLDLSYYSKGPGVAYVIALFTGVFGPTEFGVRVGAVLFSLLASWMVYLLGTTLFNSEKAGFYGALLTNITPIFSIGAVLMTTDVLFVFFWVAAVYTAFKALEDSGPGWWAATGALVGIGFLCKYTMVLLYPCLALYLLASARDRRWFARPQPYVAGLVSLAFASPVLYWNLANGLVTIKHTMGQVHADDPSFSIAGSLEFVGSQALFLTPFIFLGAIYGVARCVRSGWLEGKRGPLLAFFTSAPLFLFFLFKSFHGKVQANWAVASYMTAIPALAWAFSSAYARSGPGGKKLLLVLASAAIFSGTVLSAAAYLPWSLEYAGARRIIDRPPYNRVTGWADLGVKAGSAVEGMDGKGRVFLASDTYQITSELAFYTPGNPVVYNMNTGSRRMNQYDLWGGLQGLIGYDALYVKGGDVPIDEAVSAAFDTCTKELVDTYMGRRKVKVFSFFRCHDFKGLERVDPSGLKF